MNSRLYQQAAAAIIAAALLSQLAGCGYPQVSPKTYELSKALYSVCNQKSAERLPIISELIQDSLADGSIGESEGKWLNDIIAIAQNGDWESAAQSARRILADQVDRQ